jgi:hypothetical protein
MIRFSPSVVCAPTYQDQSCINSCLLYSEICSASGDRSSLECFLINKAYNVKGKCMSVHFTIIPRSTKCDSLLSVTQGVTETRKSAPPAASTSVINSVASSCWTGTPKTTSHAAVLSETRFVSVWTSRTSCSLKTKEN